MPSYPKGDLAWASAIRAVRARAGLSQLQLADILKVPQQVISKLERGERPLKAREIVPLSKAVKMTPKQLFSVFLALYQG